MCNLRGRSSQKQREGFKIVIKKNGEYYSAAMGFKYRTDRKIPVVKRQRRLTDWFNQNILTRADPAFEARMVGRTAIFLDDLDAQDRARKFVDGVDDGDVTIVKATVSQDVMLGIYGGDGVAAGRRIKFGKETWTGERM